MNKPSEKPDAQDINDWKIAMLALLISAPAIIHRGCEVTKDTQYDVKAKVEQVYNPEE